MRNGLALLLILSLLAPGVGRAEEAAPVYSGETGDKLIPAEEGEGVAWGLEADFVSQYVWRGIALSEGPVLQPSGWLSYQGAIFSVWGNFVLNDEANQGRLNEVDFTLGYGRRFRDFFVGTLFLFYLYPHQDVAATGEGSVILGFQRGPFTVFTAQLFDMIAAPGAYFGVAGGAFEWELHEKLSMKASAGFAWANAAFNEANFEVSKFAANLFVGNLEFTWTVKGPLYLRPHVKVSVLLDEGLRSSVDEATLINGGLAVGVEF
ncbi:MAG TPA: hypothetical protein VJR29_12260 [bacterium]|nr:hypothetical protein [bacterium]